MHKNVIQNDPVIQVCDLLIRTVLLGYTVVPVTAYIVLKIRSEWLKIVTMSVPLAAPTVCPMVHEAHKDKINRIREHLGQRAEPAPHRKYQAEPATKAEWDPYIRFLELEHAEGRLRKYTVDQAPPWLAAYTDSKTIIFETDDLRVAFRDERPRFQVLSCTVLNLRTGEVMEKQCLEQGGIMPSTDC